MDTSSLSTGNLVKKARIKQGSTQIKFAIYLGKAQSEVSKYERGVVDPPGSVIVRCMHILKENKTADAAPSVADIIEKLNDGFDSPNHAMARSLIMGIILNDERKSA